MDCCHTLFNLISNQRDRLFIFPFGSTENVERKYFQCIYFQFKHRIVLHQPMYRYIVHTYVQVLRHLKGQKSSLNSFKYWFYLNSVSIYLPGWEVDHKGRSSLQIVLLTFFMCLVFSFSGRSFIPKPKLCWINDFVS